MVVEGELVAEPKKKKILFQENSTAGRIRMVLFFYIGIILECVYMEGLRLSPANKKKKIGYRRAE